MKNGSVITELVIHERTEQEVQIFDNIIAPTLYSIIGNILKTNFIKLFLKLFLKLFIKVFIKLGREKLERDDPFKI